MTTGDDHTTDNVYGLPDLDEILNEPAAPPNAVEIMRIWRDEKKGAMIIQIDDQYHYTRGDVKAAGQERIFMGTLRQLAKIAKETGNIVTPPPIEPPPPELKDEPSPVEDIPESVQEVAPEPADSPAPSPEEADLIEQIVPSSVGESATEEEIGTFFRNPFRRKPKNPAPTPPKSFAEQIEELLQERLQASGELSGRTVHIREAVGGGIIITVDGTAYEGVGDIAEQDVRAFVQATIRQWEKRQ